jgi:hypothetical protein
VTQQGSGRGSPARPGPRGRPAVHVVLAGLVALVALAIAACGPAPSPVPWPSPVGSAPAPGGLARFAEGGLTFDYPASWRESHHENLSSFTSVIAYLATVDVHDPCVRTPDSMTCGAAYRLEPGTLAVTVGTGSFPGFNILEVPTGAKALTAGGLPGYVQDAEPSAETGATASRTWTLAMPGSVDNYFSIRADAREPGTEAAFAQVDELVASLAYDPPVVPLPSGEGAADAAVRSALDEMIRSEPAYACFPTSGSRRSVVSALPGMGLLAAPQVATCSTAIEATPLQLWRVHLVARLSERDSQAARGDDIVMMVTPDGQPGWIGITPLAQ